MANSKRKLLGKDSSFLSRSEHEGAEKSKSSIEKATRARMERQKRLESVGVELQVLDAKHARSPEVITYCIEQLSQGVTYSELRRKLGVGPAHMDHRWRVVREHLTEAILPKNEDEALKSSHSMLEYMADKIDELHDYLEERSLAQMGSSNEHHFLKLRIEALKLMSEKYEKKFEHWAEMKKVRAQESSSRGASIIVNFNHSVPRPGDDVKDVTPQVTKLAGKSGE